MGDGSRSNGGPRFDTFRLMTAPPSPAPKGMAWIPGGTFLMGSNFEGYDEESPPHTVTVDGFFMDENPVTVGQFQRFVKETGYVTIAERPLDPAYYPNVDPSALVPGSMVFHRTKGPVNLKVMSNWWSYVQGAQWRHPEGPGSGIGERQRHPVVHVCWEDVEAYAAWAGKALATEAEWEFAARGGLHGATYAWGDEFAPGGKMMANTWQGDFPWANDLLDGHDRTSPVGSFRPNGYGLYDMTGNVWEWTSDFYTPKHPDEIRHACCVPSNPRVERADESYDTADPGAAHIPRKVIKGGSHLCAPNYCHRYRPAARQPQMVETSMSHIGFRCIVRP